MSSSEDLAGIRTPDQIQSDLDQERHELGRTVDALSSKLDVKGRAQDRVSRAADQVQKRASDAQQRAVQLGRNNSRELALAGGLLLVAAVCLMIWRRQ